jgi:hypothetical protein
MFNIDSEPTVRAKIEIRLPGEVPQDFTAAFRVLDVDTFNSFDLSDAESCRAFIQAIVIDLGDIVDGKGKNVPYSGELRDRLVNQPIIRAALVRSYVEEVGRAAQGN